MICALFTCIVREKMECSKGSVVVVESAHDARVGARMMNYFAFDGLLDLSRFGTATFSFGGEFTDFLADDTLDDALLHLPAAVTASGAGTGSWSGSGSVAGSGSTGVGSVRAGGIGSATAVITSTSAVLRVVDNFGTWESVAGTGVVDVGDEDSWVGIGVATWESNDITSGWDFSVGFVRVTHAELNASGVELGATWRATIVQCEDLVTEEVFTGRQVGRESDVESRVGIVIVEGQGPKTVIHSSLFVNLEPLGLRGIETGATSGTARSHIGHDWAGIVDPCTTFTVHPTDTEVGAWVGVGDESGWSSALSTAEVGVVGSFDGIDRENFTDGVLLTVL